MRLTRVFAAVLLAGVAFLNGCVDQGVAPPPPAPVPEVQGLSRDTIAVGEEIDIVGTGFGANDGNAAVVFANDVAATEYPLWTETRITARVPEGAVSGPVRVRRGNVISNGRALSIAATVMPGGDLTLSAHTATLAEAEIVSITISGGTPPYVIVVPPDGGVAQASITAASLDIRGIGAGSTSLTIRDASLPVAAMAVVAIQVNPPPATVSFAGQIVPIFSANCVGCHGGTANMFLTPTEAYSNLINVPAQTGTCAGTPRVNPGNSAQSALYLRVNGVCSQRMPLGGRLPDADIALIRQWIDEGARNN